MYVWAFVIDERNRIIVGYLVENHVAIAHRIVCGRCHIWLRGQDLLYRCLPHLVLSFVFCVPFVCLVSLVSQHLH